jgi:hypothetical protein
VSDLSFPTFMSCTSAGSFLHFERVDDLRIMLLADLRPAMGEIKVDTVVTMHVIVRAAGAGKSQGKPGSPVCDQRAVTCVLICSILAMTKVHFGVTGPSKEKERQQGCYCLIQ